MFFILINNINSVACKVYAIIVDITYFSISMNSVRISHRVLPTDAAKAYRILDLKFKFEITGLFTSVSLYPFPKSLYG
jgi:hypothetical protein